MFVRRRNGTLWRFSRKMMGGLGSCAGLTFLQVEITAGKAKRKETRSPRPPNTYLRVCLYNWARLSLSSHSFYRGQFHLFPAVNKPSKCVQTHHFSLASIKGSLKATRNTFNIIYSVAAPLPRQGHVCRGVTCQRLSSLGVAWTNQTHVCQQVGSQ